MNDKGITLINKFSGIAQRIAKTIKMTLTFYLPTTNPIVFSAPTSLLLLLLLFFIIMRKKSEPLLY